MRHPSFTLWYLQDHRAQVEVGLKPKTLLIVNLRIELKLTEELSTTFARHIILDLLKDPMVEDDISLRCSVRS